ncbi:MAG TPA: DUF2510 domain-containing protein [Ilumatobacteraceae bacterium]|jgi:hypothetical protein
MYEYATISSSSYDPASLASKLTEKSAEGWTVAAIVPTGGDVTAFLSRESSGAAAPAAAPMQEAAPAPAPEPVMAPVAAEPAGWAVAPDPAPAMSSAPATVIQTPMAQISDSYQPANTYQPAAAPAPAPAPAAAPTPAVPAGWYADPAGRFELRYWDGSTWTEHVSTGGVQSTNPPVA